MLVGVVKFKPSLHNFLLRVRLFSSLFSFTLTRKRLVANEIRLLVSSRNSSILFFFCLCLLFLWILLYWPNPKKPYQTFTRASNYVDTSEVCNHIQSNTDHKMDFNNPQILTHSPDKYKHLNIESLFI